MSNANIAFLTGLLNGGLDQYKLNRTWKRDDDFRKAIMDAVKAPVAGDQGAPPAQAQASPSDRESILREFSDGQPQPQQQQQQQQPNSAASVGNWGVETNIQVPPPSQQLAQLPPQQAAPTQAPVGNAPEQATTAPVTQSRLPSYELPPGSIISRQEPVAIAGVAAAREAIARQDAAAPAPSVAEQVRLPAAALGDGGGGVAGQGFQNAIDKTDSRGLQEVDRLKKFAYAAAVKGDMQAAYQFVQEAQNRQYAHEDLKYAVGVANDPAGKEAQKLIKMIGGAGLPGTTVVTDPDTGVATVKLQQPDGSTKDIVLKGSTLMRTAVAYCKAMRGDPSALADLAAVDKDYAAQALASWQFNTHMAQVNNSAANIKSSIDYRNKRAAAQDSRLDAQDRQADAKQKQEAALRSATAALSANPNDRAAIQNFYIAGGKASDAAHLSGATKENSGGDKYQVQVDAVRKALSSPQLDAQGKPVMNLMTGTPNMVPDLAREKRLVGFMNAAGIKNTNEGLLKFQQAEDVLKGVQPKYIEALAANPNAKLPSGKTVAQALDEQYQTPGLSALALAMRQEQSASRR